MCSAKITRIIQAWIKGKKFSANDPFKFPYMWWVLVDSLVSLYKPFVLTNWFSYWEFSFVNKNSFEETNLFNWLLSSPSYTNLRELSFLASFLHVIVWLACFFSVALALKLKQAQHEVYVAFENNVMIIRNFVLYYFLYKFFACVCTME